MSEQSPLAEAPIRFTLLAERLSDQVSPFPWVAATCSVADADGKTVCTCPGPLKIGNMTLIALTPQLAQGVLDLYPLIAEVYAANSHHATMREAFKVVGELYVALEPVAVAATPDEDDVQGATGKEEPPITHH